MAKKSNKASFFPLLVAIIAIFASGGIYVINIHTAHAFIAHLIGYLLTPLIVSLCLAWDSIGQRIGRGNDPWFENNTKYPFILRLLTIFSFLIAFPHILAMAKDIAEKIAGQ